MVPSCWSLGVLADGLWGGRVFVRSLCKVDDETCVGWEVLLGVYLVLRLGVKAGGVTRPAA